LSDCGSDDKYWHQAGGQQPRSTDRQQKAGPPKGTYDYTKAIIAKRYDDDG
jgi:hypothetical protein